LSKNRALDARRILRALGIDKSRISYEYYGKTIPAIDCEAQPCSEEEHSLNRRTVVEFAWN
jgi:outer membrane protein OmpA-like peptidoglycan-associated protein